MKGTGIHINCYDNTTFNYTTTTYRLSTLALQKINIMKRITSKSLLVGFLQVWNSCKSAEAKSMHA